PHTKDRELDMTRHASNAETDDSGHYILSYPVREQEGAVIGLHGVSIINAEEKGLPKAYSSAEPSVGRSMWVTVESGAQTVDIPLESSPSSGNFELHSK